MSDTKRNKTRQKLVNLGFTASEIQAAEEIAAKNETSVLQVLRSGLRIYQAQHKGLMRCVWIDEPTGCGVVE